MTQPRRTLSLAGLRDFEAAARSGSFAGAGQELGVSASAVSQQVKMLEERLGVRLFDRRPQSLVVTAAGRKLLASLSSAFDLIEQSLGNLTQTPKDRLVLAMPASFAVNWFLPRMQRFRANYPAFEIVPRSSGGMLQPSMEGVDACIRHGRAGWGDLDCRFLFNDALLPLCSPGYLEQSVAAGIDPGTIRGHRLLASETAPNLWQEWPGYRGAGEHTASGFGDDSLLIQATLNGHGVALLDRNLLSDFIRDGLLVPFAGFDRWVRGTGWHLVFDQSQQSEEIVTALIDWMLDELATSSHDTQAASCSKP